MREHDKWCPENDGAYRAEMAEMHRYSEGARLKAAHATGYREGLESAAVYHDRHAEGYSRTRSRLDEAAHRTHAAAIRAMKKDTP